MQVPENARVCPNCGASIAVSGPRPESPHYDPTYISPPSNYQGFAAPSATPPPPSPSYSTNPYPYDSSSSSPNLYTPYDSPPPSTSSGPYATDPYSGSIPNPYTPPPPPPTPPAPRRSNRLPLIVGIAILVLLLIGGGVFALLRANSPSAPAGPTTAQLNATSTARAATARTATAVAANATATAVAAQNPYPPNTGTLALNDPLKDNSKGYQWDEINDTNNPNSGTCVFRGGVYHVTEGQTGYFQTCNTKSTHFSDFAYQIQMTILKGDGGGIVFRTDNSGNNLYYFSIYRDGTYQFSITNSTTTKTILTKHTSAINTTLNQPNLIAVVAQGNTFDFYINKQHVGTITDKTYIEGRIGVAAEDVNNSTDVAFSNAEVWIL